MAGLGRLLGGSGKMRPCSNGFLDTVCGVPRGNVRSLDPGTLGRKGRGQTFRLHDHQRAGFTAPACRGVLRGGLRLRCARPLDPSNLNGSCRRRKQQAPQLRLLLGRAAPLFRTFFQVQGIHNHEPIDSNTHRCIARLRRRFGARPKSGG